MVTNIEIPIPDEFIEAGLSRGLSVEQIESIFSDALFIITVERTIPDYLNEIISELDDNIGE